MKKQSLSLFIVLISSALRLAAADHHHKPHHEEINININGTEQCPAQERNICAKIGAMGVQIAENRSFTISAASTAGLIWLTRNGISDSQIPKVGIFAACGWIGGGMALNTAMRAIMSQWNIPKL